MVVRSCVHCFRMYCPVPEPEEDRFCPDCAVAMARLEAECALRPDPRAARITVMEALDRLSRLSRRAHVFPPTSLRELVCWLQQNPHVRITSPTPESAEPTVRDEAFVRMEDGRLWFVALNSGDGTSIPIVCMLSERAAQVETGLEFDAAGFTITKFGVPIRVEYER